MESMRVLVADDHEIVRRGLCSLIEGQPGWTVAAEAAPALPEGSFYVHELVGRAVSAESMISNGASCVIWA